MGVGFIQEPWTVKDLIKGLPTQNCKLIYSKDNERPRAALLLGPNISPFPLTEFIKQDIAAAIVEIPTATGTTKTVIASAYFPIDESQPPPPDVSRLVKYCSKKRIHLIIGCDANSHHTAWGSTDTRDRGEYLLEFINTNNLVVANIGNKPTYRHEGLNREEVLDLTICSSFLKDKIKNWHVSDEPSLSDHKHICFSIEAEKIIIQETRIPKNTDWEKYKITLQNSLENSKIRVYNSKELNEYCDSLIGTIVTSFKDNCPISIKKYKRDVPWWSKKLDRMKKSLRKLDNETKNSSERGKYRKALTEYNKEIRKAKRNSFRNFCGDVNDTPTASRLQKILNKDHSNPLGTLVKPDGQRTVDQKESLVLLMETHIPGSQLKPDKVHIDEAPTIYMGGKKRIWEKSKKIFDHRRVKWAIRTFSPFKSPGPDEIFPALLQKGQDVLVPYLSKLFRLSYTMGFIPNRLRDAKIVFIPKAGKRDPEQPKSYRPISLTSFLLKTMEKLIDTHLKETVFQIKPLHKMQFAYQSGKSTIDALHHLVKKVENALEHKEIALTAFLDIEGAFDNTGFDSIKTACIERGIETDTVTWLDSMLKSRVVTATLGGETIVCTTTRGCPQGGVTSPLLWSLVVDDLLNLLESEGFEVIGYADDIVLMVRGKVESTISSRIQAALNLTWNWCTKHNLSINPSKTVIVPFTKRREPLLKKPKLNGTAIEFSKEVKYLGLHLDSKLNWGIHIKNIKDKSIKILMACRNIIGQKWGLNPKMMYWLYTSVIRPITTYASLVWWPKVDQKNAKLELSKIQRLATLAISGANRTAPSIGLDAMLNLPPLHIKVKETAIMESFRILGNTRLKPGDLKGHVKIMETLPNYMALHKISDCMPKTLNFDMPFQTIIPSRKDWLEGGPAFETDSLQYFTDGSRKDGKVGIGVYGPSFNHHKALGSTPTIFQAEIHAIEICALRCIQRGDIRKRTIYILSDSQAAIRALRSSTVTSKLVNVCLNTLKKLASLTRLIIMWVPGHRGIAGNELADELARKGAESKFIGPEPFCGFGRSNLKEKVTEWVEKEKLVHFNNLNSDSISRTLIEYSSKRTRDLLKMSRTRIGKLTRLCTGHGPFKGYLTRIGIITDSNCRFCNEKQEDAIHILCECNALARIRQDRSFFGTGYPKPNEIKQISPYKITRFYDKLDLETI
jgi:ribonuclease HI